MSSIEKLLISGIRSFSPQESNVIEFYTPLTLIVGENGTGKTTIIECLKYATTGDMPPNSNKGAFVHDPKIAGEREVKARVKLRFKNTTGHTLVATRNMQLTQKTKKLEFKTLENNLQTVDTSKENHKESFSARCGDMDTVVPNMLGVSKAILNNVIFCHQEDSNWPLSEPSKLKQKFDDIFAADKYIKVMESIKKVRLEHAGESKTLAVNLEHLSKLKEKAESTRKSLEAKKRLIRDIREQKQGIEEKVDPTKEELEKVRGLIDSVRGLNDEISSKKSKCESLQEEIKSLKNAMTRLLTCSDDELLSKQTHFKKNIDQKRGKLSSLQKQSDLIGKEIAALESKYSSLMSEEGRLRAEEKAHNERVSNLGALVNELATKSNLTEFCSDSYSFSQAQSSRFIAHLNTLLRQYREECDKQSKANFEAILAVGTKVDEWKGKISELQESVKVKEKSATEGAKRIQQMALQLSETSIQEEELVNVETSIVEAEATIGNANFKDFEKKNAALLKQLTTEKSVTDERRNTLNDEMIKRTMQGKIIASIDFNKKSLADMSKQLEDVEKSYGQQMELFFTNVPEKDFLLKEYDRVMKQKANAIKALETKLSKANEAKVLLKDKMARLGDSLSKARIERDAIEKELDAFCGLCEDFAKMFKYTENDLKSKREQLDPMRYAVTMYEKFQSQSEKSDCCPLCKRGFDEALTKDVFVNSIESVKSKIPSVTLKMENEVEELSRKVEGFRKLQSKYDTWMKLKYTEIPKLEKESTNLDLECVSVESDFDELSESLENEKVLEVEARQLLTPISKIERLHKDIKKAELAVSKDEAKLIGTDCGTSLEDINRESRDLQLKSEMLNNQMDKCRKDMQNEREKCRILENNLRDLREQKLKLESQAETSKRIKLEKERLEDTLSSLKNEICEMKARFDPFQERLKTEQTAKERLVKENRSTEQKQTAKLNKMQNEIDRVKALSSDVEKFFSSGKSDALQRCTSNLEEIQIKKKEKVADCEGIMCDLEETKLQVHNQETEERCLNDNVALRSKESELEKVRGKVFQLEQTLASKKLDELRASEKRLCGTIEDLKEERSLLIGKLKVYEENVKATMGELKSDLLRNVDERHRKVMIDHKTNLYATNDLEKYAKAMDIAIMQYHKMKMEEINKLIKELWISVYRGTDIETIEIRSDADNNSSSTSTRKTYNYRVVMIKNGSELDMRGRCSAGQKVLTSLIIRLALAESFCLNCGILALDEPTTNLDKHNIESFANALANIVQKRKQQSNFQLIVITHDMEFVTQLCRSDYVQNYWKIQREGNSQTSVIRRCQPEKVY
eukprot:Nk52_evm12s298 gene=Nk52_evmTU12s298